MTITVEITCKDPSIEKYCRRTYQEKFDRVLSWGRGGDDPEGELTMFRNTLRKEARRQEWYEYHLEGDGDFIPHRSVVERDEEGKPKLLVPEVRIVHG